MDMNAFPGLPSSAPNLIDILRPEEFQWNCMGLRALLKSAKVAGGKVGRFKSCCFTSLS